MIDQDLFNQDYTSGNLAEIKFITSIVGRLAVIIISVVGFGIVLATILKNALHGLYAVSPKLWDKVDEAKKVSLSQSSPQGGNQISKVMGSLSIVFLNCLPNVKALTDFEDEVLDAKAYFMKAIPLACVQIFIGVFIFFGYPSKVAEKFSDFGKGLFDVVLINVDPVAWVEAIPDKMIRLDLSTDGSKNDVDKAINKIAREVYNSYVGELDDMTAEKRNEVSRRIEQWVIDQVEKSGIRTYCDEDRYKLSATARITIAEPDVSKVDDKSGKDGEHSFAKYVPLDTWEHGSAKATASKYIRFDLLFTPVASKGAGASVENKMSISAASIKKASKKITITVAKGETSSTYSVSALAGAKGVIKIKNKSEKVTLSVEGNVITVKSQTSGKDITDYSTFPGITGISGLYYVHGSQKHPIKEIYGDGSSKATFTPIDAAGNMDKWSWGDSPTKKTESSSSKKSTSTKSKSSTKKSNSSKSAGWSN